MELIVTLLSNKNLERYLSSSSFIVGNQNYATRIPYSFSLDDIKSITEFAHANNKKVYVNVNKVFTQSEIKTLISYLEELKKINVDYILFSDFAIYTLAKKLNIMDKLVYYSETQLVNKCDSLSLASLGIKNQIVSKDAKLKDIEAISKVNDIELGIMVYGYYHLFYSKRKLLSSYCKEYKLDEKQYIHNYNLRLKEYKRDEFHPVIEDDNGLNIFSGEILLSIDYLDYFISLGYKKFIIDGIFENEDDLIDVISLFNNKAKYSEICERYPNKKFGTAFINRDLGVIEKVGDDNE